MIAITLAHTDAVMALFRKELEDHADYLFASLSDLCNQLADPEEIGYVHLLLDHAGTLMTAHPDELDVLKSGLDALIPQGDFSKKRSGLRDDLLQALDYSGLRAVFFPAYFQKLGIKSCVYCNALLTVSVERVKKGSRKFRAKFQADHYYAKSENPGLSISLYNLYPVCANCNLAKGIKKIKFRLFEPSSGPSPAFRFALKDGCRVLYLLHRDINLLEIGFSEPAAVKGFESFNTVFDIEGIYQTQLDVAEELILKAEAYTEAYKAILRHQYPRIFSSEAVINRMLIGNYVGPDEIHKRPLAKFMRDISLDIGLLPPDP